MSTTTQDGHLVITTETMVLPAGCDPATDPNRDWDAFAVYVRWQGPPQANGSGGWAVTGRVCEKQLSRAGNWAWGIRAFQRRQYRFATFDEALAMAHAHVDQVTVNGRTWAQWQQHWQT